MNAGEVFHKARIWVESSPLQGPAIAALQQIDMQVATAPKGPFSRWLRNQTDLVLPEDQAVYAGYVLAAAVAKDQIEIIVAQGKIPSMHDHDRVNNALCVAQTCVFPNTPLTPIVAFWRDQAMVTVNQAAQTLQTLAVHFDTCLTEFPDLTLEQLQALPPTSIKGN